MQSLKSSLKEGLPTKRSPLTLFGTCYLIYPEGLDGHYTLNVLPDQAAADQLSELNNVLIDEIRGDIFKQVMRITNFIFVIIPYYY